MTGAVPDRAAPAASSPSTEPSGRRRVYLIDGYGIIFRAFFALPPLSNSKGFQTNAVLGFVNMLRKLLREHDPALVGIALDVGGKTFRSERFADYKATRTPMPEELRAQLPFVRRALEAFRIPVLELAGYEADDVIGTIACKAAEGGYDVVLVSADKDLMQLVGDRVSFLHTGREKVYDRALVEADFGVPPEQIPDVLALMGDTIDNVPGVKGIGDKGAKKLIQQYGSLENLLEHAPEVSHKTYREGLLRYADDARMSKELATIVCDLPVEFDPEALEHERPDPAALAALYRELEFFSLLKEMVEADGALSSAIEIAPAREVESVDAWREAAARLPARVQLAVVGLPPIGLAVETAPGAVLLADFRRGGLRQAAIESLRTWLGDSSREVAGHDVKEALRLAGWRGEVPARLADSMLLAYLLRASIRDFTLEEVCFERLRLQPLAAKDAGWRKGEEPMPGDPTLLEYAAQRAALPRLLLEQMERECGEPGAPAAARRVYDTIEAPLIPVLVAMEEKGVLLDCEYLRAMSVELERDLTALEEEIYRIAGEPFNINSPQQLGSILFEKLSYPVLKRTRKTKSYSTGADTLESLAAQGFDLPERILRFREWGKLKSTYVDALPLLVDAEGRLHTRFEQAVAATGRLSSTNPNLQNIPIRTETGRRIRKAFRAPAGWVLLVADYSQIELRILAHIAEEPVLVEAFRRGEDIHASTAALVFGGTPALVTPDQRRAAKVINFGIIYGMSPFGLAANLGIDQKDAARFIEAYFERLPRVRAYTEETIERARRDGRVETLYGRARWLPDIGARNWNLRENARRMAINARIQGTAADLLKMAMVRVERRLAREGSPAALLLTVHDELVLEAPADAAAEVGSWVKEEMEGVERLAVPLVVEVGWGADWYDAKGG
ncbi:MAG TPA: DNA polymerase I [Thermoanaerobaculia bacterium]|nr:DNA polymerase I [Thermoanaerobaculia bacterium]